MTARQETLTMDQLHAAADAIGVPWDRSAKRPDGTPYWTAPAERHVLFTSDACACTEGEVTLFFDADGCFVSAPEGHSAWGSLTGGDQT
jgi:hypothetical protein